MKKVIVSSLLVYVIFCVLALILPSSDEYNTIGWKLLIGQIYAVPALIGSFFIFYQIKIYRKNKNLKI